MMENTKAATEVNAETKAVAEVNAEPETITEVNAEKKGIVEMNTESETSAEMNAEAETAAEAIAEKEAAAESSAEPEAAATEPATEVILQYRGYEMNMDDVTERVKGHYMSKGFEEDSIENMQIYVKPEDFTAYYVINDGIVGKVNLF